MAAEVEVGLTGLIDTGQMAVIGATLPLTHRSGAGRVTRRSAVAAQ